MRASADLLVIGGGITGAGVALEGRELVLDGERCSCDLTDAAQFERLCATLLGARLVGGIYMTGGFFLGPRDFYERLRTMPPQELAKIDMTRIDFINQLYGRFPGESDLKRAQRRKARFMNTTMIVTLLGAACSDALESGQVVSGVGGQYNFVAMAHALRAAGRSFELLDRRVGLAVVAERQRVGQPLQRGFVIAGHQDRRLAPRGRRGPRARRRGRRAPTRRGSWRPRR